MLRYPAGLATLCGHLGSVTPTLAEGRRQVARRRETGRRRTHRHELQHARPVRGVCRRPARRSWTLRPGVSVPAARL